MKCEFCNNELIEIDNGISTFYICPICDGTPVTQNSDPRDFDLQEYEISILPYKDASVDYLRKVSKICECNFLQARNFLLNGGITLPPMNVFQTGNLKLQLDELGIIYSILPEYRW